MNRYPERLDHGHPFRQWKTWPIPGTGLTLTGYSRSNDKTFFHLPELRCSLDAGLAEGRQPETVLLTHAHADHAADLAYLAARPAGVDIHLPAASLPAARAFIEASFALNNAVPFDPALAGGMRLHGMADGDEFAVGRRGTHTVRVVACHHKVPCVGYCFSSHGRALRPELEALRRFVLTHFSLRHSDADVIAFFDKEDLPNVTVWAHPQSLIPEQHQHR